MADKLIHLGVPAIFVVLGGTGDLAKKKVIPSLWRLFHENLLPEKCAVVGIANTDISAAGYRKYVREVLEKHIHGFSQERVEAFLDLFRYVRGDFETRAAFEELAQEIETIEGRWGLCSNKVFFVAASPVFYQSIFTNLAAVKLNLPCGGDLGWTRILIEKPFGVDLQSSRRLQKLLLGYFKEEQIYRIDHYLAKEIVQGISNFRFSNNLFENSWGNKLVERIEIRLFETAGVEQRGPFYDSVGAFMDVGQNHLLELLSLITMRFPNQANAQTVRQNRAEMLATLKPWSKHDIQHKTYRAQYQGYREIEGVAAESQAETFFALETELRDPNWSGVPISIEGGKRCGQVKKEIVVTLTHPPICFLCEPGKHTKNQVIFEIDPESRVSIKFWTKKPGLESKLEERRFSFFLYEKEEKAQYVEEYAKLLYEGMVGDQTLFVSKEEVENLWQFTDPVIKGWKNNLVPLATYPADTTPNPVFPETAPPAAAKKEITVVGLGKMGANIARRLKEKGWTVHGFDRSPAAVERMEKEGLRGISDLAQSIRAMVGPRIIWLMVPAGGAVDDMLFGKEGVVQHLERGDIVIDGGNSFYADSIARFKKLKKLGIHFIDAGVSGGPKGARNGAALMIGGEKAAFVKCETLFTDLAQENGCRFFEGAGAGHFVKMIHNGIEYGMMQAIAEGFSILKKSAYRLDLAKVADAYNHGSVIESRLIGWLRDAFELRGQELKKVSGSVQHTGEGQWTVKTAKAMHVKAKVIEEALKFRIHSAKHPDYTGKVVSALREQFGGHHVAIHQPKEGKQKVKTKANRKFKQSKQATINAVQ